MLILKKFLPLSVNAILCFSGIFFSYAYGSDFEENESLKKSGIINSITINGLNNTMDFVIERELISNPGQMYDYNNWIIEKNRFESLGVFADSSLDIQENENGLDLEYSFKELPPLIPFIAVKSTDQNGFMAGPAMAFMNLFGEAVRVESFYRVSIAPEYNQAKEYMLYLASEWIRNIPLEYEIFAVYYDLYNPLKCFNEHSMLFSIDSAYRLNKIKIIFAGEIFRVMHDYDNELFVAGGKESDLFLSESSSEYVPKLGTGLIWDRRDRLINAHSGIYNEIRVSGYGGPLGGPADYAEYLYDFRGYHTFLNKHILHLSLLGQYRPGTMGAYDYFHVGGTNTLRSYDQDPSLYGQHEFLGTLEYRYEVIGRRRFSLQGMNLFIGLQLIAGMDMAILWEKNDNLIDGRSLEAYYTGIHILFPGFNRMRIEFGFHEDENNPGKIQFGFTFGFYEKSTVQRWQVR